MFKYISPLLCLTVILLFASCQNHESHNHNTDNHGHDHKATEHTAETDAHDHEAETQVHNHGEKLSYTIINKGYELFMEMDPLVQNHPSSFIIHITRLSDYHPLNSHEIEITLKGMDKIEEHAHSHTPGIFHVTLTPKQAGVYQFAVHFNDNNEKHEIAIEKMLAYKSEDDIQSEENHKENLITYLKEQAWNEEFGITEVTEEAFPLIIKTSGKILPAPGDETLITAVHSGTINLNSNLIEGKKVAKGQVISKISSNLIHENLRNKYLEAKNRFEKAKIEYNRAKKLIDEKLISESEFLEAKLNYESTKNNFENIARFYNDGNENVVAPTNGYIRTVFVQEGQFIEDGQPIASIIKNKRIVLKADIPQQYNNLAPGFYTANFSPVYTDKLFILDKLNGERTSYSSALSENSFFTAVYFEFDANKEIIPGSYAEVFLKSAFINNSLLIPASALMEDQGNYFVFVMDDGEHYEKRYIGIGNTDGQKAEVTHGLEHGEYIVSKGAYHVYLASLGNAAPAHTHSH